MGAHGSLGAVVLAAVALLALTLLLRAPMARAATEFCPPGSGAGECGTGADVNSQRGLAVDYESGLLYVADRGNNRVDVFEEDGTFVFAFGWGVDTGAQALQTCTTASTCQAGLAGVGAGQFKAPVRIAVDNDPASISQHAIYVAEEANIEPEVQNHRVQKFDPTGAFLWMVGEEVDKTSGADLCTQASGHTCGRGLDSEAEGGFKSGILPGVSPGGVLYVVDSPRTGGVVKQRLQRFEPSGAVIPPEVILSAVPETSQQISVANAIAVDSAGNAWVSTQADGFREYSATGALLAGPIDTNVDTRFLALDEGGNLFAQQLESKDKRPLSYQVVARYDASGAIQHRFGYDELEFGAPFAPEGLAVGNAGPFLSVGDAGIKLLLDQPPGPIIAPSSVEASPRSVWAAISAEINPEGKTTKYEVEYVDKHSYETEGGFASPKTRSGGEVTLGATDSSIHAIEDAIAGCKPYSDQAFDEGKCLIPETEYRFRLKVQNEDGEDEAEGEFTTLKPVEFEALYASEVGTDGATLNAEVNPLGSAATGHFQYIDEAGYEVGIKAAEEEGKSRVEAEEEGRGFDHAIEAPDVGGGAAPIDFGAEEATAKRSVALYPLGPGTTYRYRLLAADHFATVISEAKAFTTFKPQGVEPGSCPANEAFRSGPGGLLPGCRAYELVSPLEKGGNDIRVLEGLVLEQSADSGERLAFGSVRSFGDAASAPLTSQYIAQRVAGEEWRTHSIASPRGEPVITLGAQTDTEFKFFSNDLCQAWQVTVAEPPLAEGGVEGFSNLYRREDRLCGPEGYEALAPLTTPQGIPGTAPFRIELQGVSDDGTHAVFRSNSKIKLANGTLGGPSQVFEAVRGVGLRLVCRLPGGSGGAVFKGSCTAGTNSSESPDTRGVSATGAVSADGERIYWTDSDFGDGRLYVRIEGARTEDVSKAAEEEAGSDGSFFWGASSDGGKAVFTTGGKLYEFTLEGKTTQSIAAGAVGVMGMSEDGSRIYFASSKALAGSGANSEGDVAVEGKPNLYLHEAGEGGGKTTFVATLAPGDPTTQGASPLAKEPRNRDARVSPDGAHAAFPSLAPLTGYDNADVDTGEAAKELYVYDAEAGKLSCASCNPSGARPVSLPAVSGRFAARIPPYETQLHPLRALSDDGNRLFFESPDRLVSRDSNGAIDVYQWEAPGAGACTPSSPSFSLQDEGCVSLISSGDSPVDSRLVEATPDGGDVFFATLSSLLPQDYGLIDIYDARVGGGLPVPPEAPPPCEGDSCHNPSAAPVQPTPASSAVRGSRKAPAKKHPRKGCPKGKRAVGPKGKRHCVPKRKHHRRRAGR